MQVRILAGLRGFRFFRAKTVRKGFGAVIKAISLRDIDLTPGDIDLTPAHPEAEITAVYPMLSRPGTVGPHPPRHGSLIAVGLADYAAVGPADYTAVEPADYAAVGPADYVAVGLAGFTAVGLAGFTAVR